MLVGGCCEMSRPSISQSEAGLEVSDQSEESNAVIITRLWSSDSVQGRAHVPRPPMFSFGQPWCDPDPALICSPASLWWEWDGDFLRHFHIFDKLAMSFISDERDAILEKMWQAKSKHQARPLSVLRKVPKIVTNCLFQVYSSGVSPLVCLRATALRVKLEIPSHGGEMILLLIYGNFVTLGHDLAPEQTAIIQN